MKRLTLVFALVAALAACVAPEAKAGILGSVWVENDTDYRMHVWANNTDLGWAEPHTSGWIGGRIEDHTFTVLHEESEDGGRSWDETVVEEVDTYNWVIQR